MTIASAAITLADPSRDGEYQQTYELFHTKYTIWEV